MTVDQTSATGGRNFSATVSLPTGNNTVTVQAEDFGAGNPAGPHHGGNVASQDYELTVVAGTAKTFTCDANGNCTANGSVTYEWDAEDRLVAINNGTLRSEFTYDGFGRRVQVVEKNNETITSTRRYVWEGTQLAEERDGNNVVLKRFSAAGVTQFQSSPGTYYYHRDHLGSIREVTDDVGNVLARYEYDAYGRRTLVAGTDLADFGYTGHYVHKPSGLHLALYRAYDADLGRWLNRDPIRERGGINLYGYVGNSPTGLRDPLGLDYGDWWDPRTWFNEGFTESWSDSANSIGEALGAMLTGNWDQLADAYDNGVFGQTEDADDFTYYGTRGAVGVACLATAAACAVGTAVAVGCPTMSVAVGPGLPFHVAYGTGGTWVHASGSTLGALRVTTMGAANYASTEAVFTMTGIPILFTEAVLATGPAATCIGAACRAFGRGWGL